MQKTSEKKGAIAIRVSDEEIIAALFSCGSNHETAAACGLSERRLYSRIRAPDFQAKLAEEKAAILERATNAAESRLSAAVDVMAGVMLDTENPGSVRTQAAEAVVRTSLRLMELTDLCRRVDAIEKQMREDDL